MPLEAPPTPSSSSAGGETMPTPKANASGTVSPVKPAEPHLIDVQPVIDGFARHGIVCSVLRRNTSDNLDDSNSRLSRLADVADILVVDWHIHVGPIESAKETLELVETVVRRNSTESEWQRRWSVNG